MKKQTNVWAVISMLLVSAAIALFVTWLISVVLVKVGITGLLHMVALMIVMPITFAISALMLARKVLLN
jgi:hypothetical protein